MTNIKLDFSQLLAEAQRPPLEFDIGDGGPPIVIEFPDGERSADIEKARMTTDEPGLILALFGLEQGERLNAVFKTAPADLPGRLVRRVFEEFEIPGNSDASSA
ncbi:MAG: hypothetical protein JWO67_6959 [Streptosporangiaceae bacterium]|nr:hypothetical protein [Streptosporangiaceae bacterium]